MKKPDTYSKNQIIVLGVMEKDLKQADNEGNYIVYDYPEIYYYINQYENDVKHLSKWENAGFTIQQIQDIKKELEPFAIKRKS